MVLLHGLLVWALLQLTGHRSPDAAVKVVAGALLLLWEQAASREPVEPAPPPGAPRRRETPGDAGRLAMERVLPGPRPRPDAVGAGAAAAPAASRTGGAIDWYSTGAAVAKDFAARLNQPGPRPLDRRATKPAAPAERAPRSVFDDDTSRVGRTTRTADGETLYWITPNCYVALGSDSIALRDVHALHEGMTFCRIPLGRRKARGDLFEEMPTQRGSRYAEKYDPASTEPQPVR